MDSAPSDSHSSALHDNTKVVNDDGPIAVTPLQTNASTAFGTSNSSIRDKEGSIANRLRAQKDLVTKFIFDAATKLPPAQPLPTNQTRASLNSLFGSALEGRDHTVCVRVRPLLKHEQDDAGCYSVVTANNPAVHVHSVDFRWNGRSNIRTNKYDADVVFGPDDSTDAVYNAIALPLIPLVLSNGMGTLLAYGQTGSGKTYTMTGIQERVAQDIFALAEQHRQTREPGWDGVTGGSGFEFTLSFVELMGKQAFDLLSDKKPVSILEDVFGAVHLSGAAEEPVTTPARFLELVERGASLRRTEATAKNATSSRSHAVCCIRVKNTLLPEAEDGILYLVDLAGSESNSDSSDHSRERIAETKEINKSLGTLKDCFRNRALIDSTDSHVHIPFRSSRLTLLLKEAFDPASARQARTTVIANLAPGITDVPQTLNTMRYIAPLRVPVRSTSPPAISDPSNPAVWTNAQLRTWVRANYPGSKIDPAVLCPTESGKQMCRLPMGEFIARCVLCDGVSEMSARLLYEKMWKLLITARLRARKRPGEAAAVKSKPVAKAKLKPDSTSAAAAADDDDDAVTTTADLKPGTFIALNPEHEGMRDKLNTVPVVALLLAPHASGAWTVADMANLEEEKEGDEAGRYELLIESKRVVPKAMIKGRVEVEYVRTSRTYRLCGVEV
ncbi:hypothetical protein HDU87_008225 [Geranomyces variabilis]|uniref:Kinesin motor domain-containing protein n=1 Tax=Geranomyces variabilis TaxID=109894 RepID=A0AAD5TD63_9FUNG|nr:hypothetical protein HDU87_008225 [Geranomyces variabilis]